MPARRKFAHEHIRRTRVMWHGFCEALGDPAVKVLLGLTGSLVLTATCVYMLLENWGFVDSLYFSVVTIATVGYGDLTPQTILGKLFTCAYIVVGIGIFVALASALADHFIDRARRDMMHQDEENSSSE